MAPAPKPRTRRSSRSGSQSANASGSGSGSFETPFSKSSPPGPRPAAVLTVNKPAAKRQSRRIAGEALVPLPARKKNPKARVAIARPAKRMPPVDTLPDAAALCVAMECDVWHEADATRPRSFVAGLWQELKSRLRAHVRRLQPRRVLLDQATARYHQLLAEAELIRPSA